MVKQQSKTAIISGASGFIGQNLIHELSLREINSIVIPRQLLYAEVPVLTEFLFKHKPSYIFHLAAYGNHRDQVDDVKAVMANWFGTWNLLKASEFLDCEAFINVGSSSMYGIKDKPMKETDTLHPDTFYAATKAGGAYLARAFARQYNKPIATVIPFSVFGEGEADNRFIPKVCKSLVTGEPFSLSPATHDWIYIKDFISGMLTACDKIQSLKGELINIGTGRASTNKLVIELLEMISKKTLVLDKTALSSNVYDSPLWVSDTTKSNFYGIKSRHTLREGLERCWEYYSKRYEKQRS